MTDRDKDNADYAEGFRDGRSRSGLDTLTRGLTGKWGNDAYEKGWEEAERREFDGDNSPKR